MKKAIPLALALSACTAAPIPPAAPQCPGVPQCRLPAADIRTNQDLARAYLSTRHELKLCKIARDTLAACLHPQESRP